MEEEIHLTKKDFKLEWFSGSGAGGQHRNKHQNCCRITHIETGLTCQGTESRSRVTNQRVAFENLAKLLIARAYKPKVRIEDTPHIRTYHQPRNMVHDKASGKSMPYKDLRRGGGLGQMIRARRMHMDEVNDY